MRYIYTVYEEKNFCRAAQRLYISQPSLSAMVKKVEAEYGITIFNRTTPLTLTPEGEYYIQTAEKMLKLDADMHQHFRELERGFSGQVSFGGSTYFCVNILSGIIRQFQNEYPNIQVGWREMRNDELTRQILARQIDFCFEVDQFEQAGISSMKFGSEEVILAVPEQFDVNRKLKKYVWRNDGEHQPFSETPAISMAWFHSTPFVFLREGNDSYARGLRICKNAGFTPNISMKVDSSMTSYHLAVAGNGAAFIRDAIRRNNPSDKLCYYRVDDALSVRDIMLYYRAEGRSRVEDTLLSFIRDVICG